jgi:hypothetical protein
VIYTELKDTNTGKKEKCYERLNGAIKKSKWRPRKKV